MSLPGSTEQENALMKVFDANNFIYQSWAYDRHDLGSTPGFGGDTAKALASIKAKTLILTGTKDLLNPDFEPKEAGKERRNREGRDDQPGHGAGACVGRRIRSCGRRVSQSRDRRLLG